MIPNKNLSRLLKKYSYQDYGHFWSDRISELKEYLQNIENYEKDTGKKVHLIDNKNQEKLIWGKFKIDLKDSLKIKEPYKIPFPSKEVKEKLIDGISNLPWDNYHIPKSHIIIDDIYYKISTLRDRISIWAIDFTKSKGTGIVGRSDEIKRLVYYCDAICLTENGNIAEAIANFLQPNAYRFGTDIDFGFSNITNSSTKIDKRIPVYYRIVITDTKDEHSRVTKNIGYPQRPTDYKMADKITNKNLERLLQKYSFPNNKSFWQENEIEEHLQILENYEKENNKKIHLLYFEDQQKTIWEKFNIDFRNSHKYENPYCSRKVKEKLIDGIISLPWDYFHYSPWNDIIIDDIYYKFDFWRNEIKIWAVDFTKPKGTGVIEESNEKKRRVFYCDVLGFDDMSNIYKTIGNFLQPTELYFGLDYKSKFTIQPVCTGTTYERFPIHYRIIKDIKKNEQDKIMKFIGYPKKSTHFLEQ